MVPAPWRCARFARPPPPRPAFFSPAPGEGERAKKENTKKRLSRFQPVEKPPGGSGAAALLGFHRIWRHKVNCPEGTREGPLGGVRQIRKKPCVARVSLHSSLAAP